MFRRDLLKNSTALSVLFLAGCGQTEPVTAIGLPHSSIDMHAHIFNAKDIPLRGFLTQVALRREDKPAGNSPYQGLINLLVSILFNRTKTAAKELSEIRKGSANRPAQSETDLLKQDEARLIQGIQDFEAEVHNDATLLPKSTAAGPSSNRRMLVRLYEILGPSAARFAFDKSAQKGAAEIAARIYRPQTQLFKLMSANNTSLFQVLRWAATMGRDRRGILSQLKTLYGKTDEIKVFSPSIVDFEYWLIKIKGDRFSPVEDQIRVMSEISKQEKDVVLLNFVSFCPLRAALETRRGNDPMRLVKLAVSRKYGFAGVKLYPPMGFLPINNAPNATFGKHAGPKVKGSDIDCELARLYTWCIKNQVPIKAHGNNSLGADVAGGCNASPLHWGNVLRDGRFTGLKVNIAHFGGFDETLSNSLVCSPSNSNGQDWETISAALTDDLTGLYVDLGYWEAAMGNRGGSYLRALKKTRDLLRTHQNLKDRIMYGSDWSMIGKVAGHQNYHVDVQTAIQTLETQTGLALMQNIMSGNAIEYLGLKHKGQQWKRLSAFFGKEHVFRKVFDR